MTSSPTSARATRPRAVVKVAPGPRFALARPRASTGSARRPTPTAAAGAESALALKPGQPGRAADVRRRRGPRRSPRVQKRGYADAKAAAARGGGRPRRPHACSPTSSIAAGALVQLDGDRADHQGPHQAGLDRSAWRPGSAATPTTRRTWPSWSGGCSTPASTSRSPWRSRRPTRPTPDGLRPVVVSLAERPEADPGARRQLRHHRGPRRSTPSWTATTCWAAPTPSRSWAGSRTSTAGWRPTSPCRTGARRSQTLDRAARRSIATRHAGLRPDRRRRQRRRDPPLGKPPRYGTYFTWGGSIDVSRTDEVRIGTLDARSAATSGDLRAALADMALDRSDDPLEPAPRLAGRARGPSRPC